MIEKATDWPMGEERSRILHMHIHDTNDADTHIMAAEERTRILVYCQEAVRGTAPPASGRKERSRTLRQHLCCKNSDAMGYNH